MRIRENLQGRKIGRLLVKRPIIKSEKCQKHYWVCLCECGNTVEIQHSRLSSKTRPTHSCGCLLKEMLRKRSTKHGASINYKASPEYNSYRQMKARCGRETCPKYKDYGARGIKVCERWLESFENFIKDMGTKPAAEYTLGRIDNDGNYEPSNCRWETPLQQGNNKRNNVFISYKGDLFSIARFSHKFQLSEDMVQQVLKRAKLTGEQLIEYSQKTKTEKIKYIKEQSKITIWQ